MSSDPERILSGNAGADRLERELLLSVRDVGPPSGAKGEAWQALAAQIAVITAVGAATTSTAAAAGKGGLAGWALSSKLSVVALGSAVALGGSYLALRAPAAPREKVEVSTAAPPPRSARLLVEVLPPSLVSAPPAPRAERVDAPRTSRPLGETRQADELGAESALLTQARAQLRAGDLAAAQSSLARLTSQFPKGVLAQEREVLSIEVLHARGNVEGARRRALSFIQANPKSPHSAKLARFVE